MWNTYRALRANGVIGINERNVKYVNALNPRKLLVRVDDKLVTKDLAAPAGIPTPELYGVIRDARDMKRLTEFIDHADGFVIKPAQGSQGKGIIVVDGPLKGGWRLSSGKRIDLDTMKFQINNMLSEAQLSIRLRNHTVINNRQHTIKISSHCQWKKHDEDSRQ